MRRHRSGAQRGMALLVVLAVLLLAAMALLGSLQVAWLEERRLGSESDTQRAFNAAEALTRDAELDILGLRADGTPCTTGCRGWTVTAPFFPQEDDDLDLLQRLLMGGHRGCLQGVCLPASVAALDASAWNDDLEGLTAGQGDSAIAATYGRFTHARPADTGNPLLNATPARAWYWVEVFRHADAAGILTGTQDAPVPDRRHPFVYRITAYVQGIRPGTRVHLRSVFVPHPQNENP